MRQDSNNGASHGDDSQVLDALAREWVTVGWRHTPDAPFDFRQRLERFYDWSSDGTQFFDDFDPNRSVNATVADYAAIWDAQIPAMKLLTNTIVGEPRTLVSGDLAVMSVQFVTAYTTADDVSAQAHTLSSLVWRRSPVGWRIIREHGSGLNHA